MYTFLLTSACILNTFLIYLIAISNRKKVINKLVVLRRQENLDSAILSQGVLQ